jgi:gamma-glutamyltranspeptidase/glutathione hydrolase
VPGVVAAGHPLTAETGADVLRAGGNAVDAALAAMGAAFTCEPLLTGLGAGGYMLVVEPGGEPVLLDFFVAAPGHGGTERRSELIPVDVSFGDAVQVFHVGAASVGAYGVPAGMAHAARRWGTVPLAELLAPGARIAREGVPINRTQGYIVEILRGVLVDDPVCAARWAPDGRPKGVGDLHADADVAEGLERLGAEGAASFYTGEVAAAAADWVAERGGTLSLEDLAAYEPVERTPTRVRFRGRDVVTNPPPSSGGILIAYALALLDQAPPPTGTLAVVETMVRAQAERTHEFVAGLTSPDFDQTFLSSRLGSTTHLSAIDADGLACAVTCSNGVGSGLVVPGTGLHLNNMMGEQDLNPLGFHTFPPGRRMPSMMSPTVVLRDGEVELALGSAGSNRIRSAITQTLLRVVEGGLSAQEAVEAPRVHFEDGTVFVEPGIDPAPFAAAGHAVQAFREPNVFFGGVQAVERDPATGRLTGGGDPRRGGSVAVA